MPALFAVAVLLGGCARAGTGEIAGRHSWTHPHVLRIVNLSEPGTLNPMVGASQIEVDLSMFWGGYLFNYNDRGELVPELATEEPTMRNGGISADGRTIVYHLRRGVKWHDDAAFSAADVLFSFRAVMNPKNNVASHVGYDLIDRIAKRDDATVVVHLRRPWAPFVSSFFTMSSSPYPVLPAHILAREPDINRVPFNSHPIGTGPFKVVSWERGTKIRFAANPNYWRGKPKLEAVEYRPIADANTILTQLRTHEVDMDLNASQAQVDELRKIEGMRVELVPFVAYVQYAFNLRHPALRDLAVRRALAYGLDRGTIIQKVTHGVQQLGEGDQPPFLWAANPKLHADAFDPAKARTLLDAAGWRPGPDGIRVRSGQRLALQVVTTTGSATGNAAGVLTQHYWRDIGVEVAVKTVNSAVMFASYGAGGTIQASKFDVAFYSWYNGADPDDSALFMCDQFPPIGGNVYHFCDRNLDAAERTALATYDRAARAKAYHAIGAILAQQKPFLNLWYIRRIAVYNTDLKNFRPAHAATMYWNPWELDI